MKHFILNPFALHARRDFLSGIRNRFASIALSKKQFPISTAGTFRYDLLALVFVSLTLALPTAVAVAAPAEEQDFAALQAETKKVFEDRVTPFFNTYCTDCHGIHKMEGGINFAPTLMAPGAPSSGKTWKQALANVKAHDMPPEDAKKQPTDEERQMCRTQRTSSQIGQARGGLALGVSLSLGSIK